MSQSVYAEFGVSSDAVTGSVEDLTEHQQAMLSKDVAVRDGDDAITFKDLEAQAEEEEKVEDEESTTEDGEGEDQESGDEEFQPLGDTPKELTESVSALDDNEAAFGDMVASAVEAGKVSAEDINTIKAEYASEGKLSDASYAKLQEAGYTKRFVDSFVRGQEALAEQYAAGVVRFAGGTEKFNRILSHLEVNDKETKDALESAIVRKDLATTKAILNLAGRNIGKTSGVQPQRTITTQGKPVVATKTQSAEAFSSKGDMIKAMSDSRYLRDAQYTQQVRAKVAASRF